MSIAEVITYMQSAPESLDALSWRDFELVTAELLASRGFEVNLAGVASDRGYDMLAVTQDPLGFESTWVVECKHSRHHRIDISRIRSLIGMQFSLGAAQALLVTSSNLTRDAAQLARRAGAVRIADRDVFLRWICEYKPKQDHASYAEQKAFESCFVSYSHKDEAFAQHFVNQLKAAGIRVWFAAEDLLPGKKIHEEVTTAIGAFDRLLVILSENSIESEWVKSEIRRARKREVIEGRRILFPVALQPFDFFSGWELFDADLGHDLAIELRQYLIPDFTHWEDPTKFDSAISKVVAGLHTA
jgi:hypothetical protein